MKTIRGTENFFFIHPSILSFIHLAILNASDARPRSKHWGTQRPRETLGEVGGGMEGRYWYAMVGGLVQNEGIESVIPSRSKIFNFSKERKYKCDGQFLSV